MTLIDGNFPLNSADNNREGGRGLKTAAEVDLQARASLIAAVFKT